MYLRSFQNFSVFIIKAITELSKNEVRYFTISTVDFDKPTKVANQIIQKNPCADVNKPKPQAKLESPVKLRKLPEQRQCPETQEQCQDVLRPTRHQIEELMHAQNALKAEAQKLDAKAKELQKKAQIVKDQRAATCEATRAKKNRPPGQGQPRKLKTVNVAVLGADSKAGQVLAFQLKQHPLVKKLYVHGDECKDLASDLNQIDTNCSVEGYNLEKQMHKCLRTADIVVLMDDRSMANCYEDIEPEERFFEIADKISEIAEKCTLFCPRAIIVSCVQPICCTVPLIQEIFKQTPWAHPMKILGCVSPLQSRMNTIVARYLDLDPTYVHVPVLGGTDFQSLIPIISQIVPNPALTNEQMEELTEIISEDFAKATPNNMCEGYSIAQFIITIARGLTGDSRFVAPALLRSNLLDRVKFMVSTVEFGEGGIITNYGIPKMSHTETRAFQRAITILLDRQKLVQEYVQENLNNGNFRYVI